MLKRLTSYLIVLRYNLSMLHFLLIGLIMAFMRKH